MTVANPALMGGTAMPLTVFTIITGIVFTFWYPEHLLRKYSRAPAAP